MSLKFDLHERDTGYWLRITSESTVIEVQASENELRRLNIDLEHLLKT